MRRRIASLSYPASATTWPTRFRRLAKDYERLAATLKGMHLAAFAIVMLARLANWTESALHALGSTDNHPSAVTKAAR